MLSGSSTAHREAHTECNSFGGHVSLSSVVVRYSPVESHSCTDAKCPLQRTQRWVIYHWTILLNDTGVDAKCWCACTRVTRSTQSSSLHPSSAALLLHSVNTAQKHTVITILRNLGSRALTVVIQLRTGADRCRSGLARSAIHACDEPFKDPPRPFRNLLAPEEDMARLSSTKRSSFSTAQDRAFRADDRRIRQSGP